MNWQRIEVRVVQASRRVAAEAEAETAADAESSECG